MTHDSKRPQLGFSAAALFRNESRVELEQFLCRYLFPLCSSMDLVATTGTARFIQEFASGPVPEDLMFGPNHPVADAAQFATWRDVISRSIVDVGGDTHGMVAITNGVVEGTIAAVHHFTDREDIDRSIYTRVLARQAMVHDVPIANDPQTAASMTLAWLTRFSAQRSPFVPRPVSRPLSTLTTDRPVLALIAHDGKKLELCHFVVRNANKIVNNFGTLITTGTTGGWIQKFLASMGHQEYADSRVVRCNSGPLGGDVQIAHAVCEGKCQYVIFFQDPQTSHPHDVDIRLFEQAIYDREVQTATARLARNWSTADLLLSGV